MSTTLSNTSNTANTDSKVFDQNKYWSVLKKACVENPDVFKYLLEITEDDYVNRIVNGTSLFHIACQCQPKIASYLLKSNKLKTEIACAFDSHKMTAIAYASQTDSTLLEELLNSEIITIDNINARCYSNMNVLSFACRQNSDSALILLNSDKITIGSINAIDSFGRTALHIACQYQPTVFKAFLECDKMTYGFFLSHDWTQKTSPAFLPDSLDHLKNYNRFEKPRTENKKKYAINVPKRCEKSNACSSEESKECEIATETSTSTSSLSQPQPHPNLNTLDFELKINELNMKIESFKAQKLACELAMLSGIKG